MADPVPFGIVTKGEGVKQRGVYLAFYVLDHLDSVFIFARTYLGIDTDWDWATGAPTGRVKDRWNIRLVPHYWFGAFFVLAHLAAGARDVMMAHGARSKRKVAPPAKPLFTPPVPVYVQS